MRMIAILAVCLCLLAGVLAGCSRRPAASASGKLGVAAGIPPIAYFADKVGGGHVSVVTLVSPGQSPHTYEPTPSQMSAVAKAALFLSTGWPFERQLLTKLQDLNKGMIVVDLREGTALRTLSAMEAEGEAHESAEAHEHEHEHEAGEPDPHIWLSPRNAIIMVAGIAKAFAKADPAHAADYQKNADALTADLRKLDQELADALAPLKGKKFFVYHPAFGYFADAYGLIQAPVEVEGKEPGLQHLQRFIDAAKAAGVKVIFVQPQFSPRSAQAVADSIGGAVVPLDDLAYDYVENLRVIARRVTSAVKPAGGKTQ